MKDIQYTLGSPYQFHAHPQNSKYVHAFGPGLSHGIVHKPADFTVVTKAAGAGKVFMYNVNLCK